MTLLKATILPKEEYKAFKAELEKKIKSIKSLNIEDLQYPETIKRKNKKFTTKTGAWDENSKAMKILLDELSFNASAKTGMTLLNYRSDKKKISDLSDDWASATGDRGLSAELKEELLESINQFNSMIGEAIPIEIETFIELTKNEIKSLKIGELTTGSKNRKENKTESKPSVNKTIGEYLFPKDIKLVLEKISNVESAKQLIDYLNKIGKPEMENFTVEMPETKENGDWAETVTPADIKEYNERVKTSAGRNIVRSYALERANEKFNEIEDKKVKEKLESILGLSTELQSLKNKRTLKVRSGTITELKSLLSKLNRYVSVLNSKKPSNLNALLGKNKKEQTNKLGYLKGLASNKLFVNSWDFKKGKWDTFTPYKDIEGNEGSATKYSKLYLKYEELESLGAEINTVLNSTIKGIALDVEKYNFFLERLEEIKELNAIFKSNLNEKQIEILDKMTGLEPNAINQGLGLSDDEKNIWKKLIPLWRDEIKEYMKSVERIKEIESIIKDGNLRDKPIVDVIIEDAQTVSDTLILSNEAEKKFRRDRETLLDFVRGKFGTSVRNDDAGEPRPDLTPTPSTDEERKEEQKKLRLQGFEDKNKVIESINIKIERENKERRAQNKKNREHNKELDAQIKLLKPNEKAKIKLKETNKRTILDLKKPQPMLTIEEMESKYQANMSKNKDEVSDVSEPRIYQRDKNKDGGKTAEQIVPNAKDIADERRVVSPEFKDFDRSKYKEEEERRNKEQQERNEERRKKESEEK